MGYIRHEVEIDKDTYNRYRKMDKRELREIAEVIADNSFYRPCAYGLYSVFLYVKDGKYILSYETQDSCD